VSFYFAFFSFLFWLLVQNEEIFYFFSMTGATTIWFEQLSLCRINKLLNRQLTLQYLKDVLKRFGRKVLTLLLSTPSKYPSVKWTIMRNNFAYKSLFAFISSYKLYPESLTVLWRHGLDFESPWIMSLPFKTRWYSSCISSYGSSPKRDFRKKFTLKYSESCSQCSLIGQSFTTPSLNL